MIIETNILPDSCSKEEPLGIAYVASSLEKKGASVSIVDFNVQANEDDASNENKDEIEGILAEKTPDVVFIGLQTIQAEEAYRLSKKIKEQNPGITVVMMGSHATLMPIECFKEGKADIVIIGEEEEAAAEIIECLKEKKDLSSVKGIAYKKDGKLYKTEKRDASNPDFIPLPAYHLLQMDKYQTNIHGAYHDKRALNVIAARGCTFRCAFCISPVIYNGCLRIRSAENIVDEIALLSKKRGISYFHFQDNDFLFKSAEWLNQFCELVEKRQLAITWICQARIDSILRHKDHLGKLKDSGCVAMEIGIESGDELVLDKINKKISVNSIVRAAALLKENSISPYYLLMAYNIGENLDSAYKSALLVHELENGYLKPEPGEQFGEFIPQQKDFNNFYEIPIMGSQFVPFPGTPYFNIIKDYGVLLAKKWSDYRIDGFPFIPHSLLNDVPVKNKLVADPEHFIESNSHNISYYSSCNLYVTPGMIESSFGDIAGFKRFLIEVLARCDGKSTVNDISQQLAKKPEAKDIRVTVAALAMLSILRLVKSGRSANLR